MYSIIRNAVSRISFIARPALLAVTLGACAGQPAVGPAAPAETTTSATEVSTQRRNEAASLPASQGLTMPSEIPASAITPVPSVAAATPKPPPEPAPPEDVWDRVRAGFDMPPLRNQYVEYYERWYQDRPEYIERLVERATPYLYYIIEEVEKRGIPTEIALLPVIESAFKPTAYSRAHAAGLWQFIPATGRRFGLKQNWWYDGRRDVTSATRAALDYLEFLNKEFDGDWFHALAAYNAGERRVQKAIRLNHRRGKPGDYQHLRLKSETRRYVPKLIAVRNIVLEPEKFGIQLARIPNQPYFAEVDVRAQIDLSVAAKSAGITRTELRRLNPAFRRWATDPDGPHRILVPVARESTFSEALAALPKEQRMSYRHYTIKRGDTLSTIARRHGVTVSAIQGSNRLRGTRIRAGNSLLIPVSARAYAARSKPKRNKAPRGTPVVHRVRSGDTLWAIARRYDVYVKQLRRWNALNSGQILRLGQKIVIHPH